MGNGTPIRNAPEEKQSQKANLGPSADILGCLPPNLDHPQRKTTVPIGPTITFEQRKILERSHEDPQTWLTQHDNIERFLACNSTRVSEPVL
jgi:hypothetical protein